MDEREIAGAKKIIEALEKKSIEWVLPDIKGDIRTAWDKSRNECIQVAKEALEEMITPPDPHPTI